MIRLDAATVLLQWATGGLLFLWCTTRTRVVGIGYGWLLRGTYGLIALGAVLPPLVAGSLERAANLAEAMEARGFGSRKPSRAPNPGWTIWDYAALVLGALLVLAAILWL